MFSGHHQPLVDGDITNGHCHHEQRAKNKRRGRRWDSECEASESQCECQHKTYSRFHSLSSLTSILYLGSNWTTWFTRKPTIETSFFPTVPGGKTCSAVTKPIVIASSKQAPINRGGAGDGISNNRHPAPTIRPRTSPTIAVTRVILQNAKQSHPKLHRLPGCHACRCSGACSLVPREAEPPPRAIGMRK